MYNIKHPSFMKVALLWLASTTCSFVKGETTTQTLYHWIPLEEATLSEPQAFTLTGFTPTHTSSIAPIATGPSGIVTYSEYASFHLAVPDTPPLVGTEDLVEGVVFAEGPSYYAEEDTMTQVYVFPTILKTTMTLSVQATQVAGSQSGPGPVKLAAQASLPPSVTVSTIGTSFFTVTETVTDAETCTFSASVGADSSPTAIGVCVGQDGGLAVSGSSATEEVETYVETLTAIMRPWTTIVFDAAALPSAASTSTGQSNGGVGDRLRTASMNILGVRLPHLFATFGLLLGGAMVVL